MDPSVALQQKRVKKYKNHHMTHIFVRLETPNHEPESELEAHKAAGAIDMQL